MPVRFGHNEASPVVVPPEIDKEVHFHEPDTRGMDIPPVSDVNFGKISNQPAEQGVVFVMASEDPKVTARPKNDFHPVIGDTSPVSAAISRKLYTEDHGDSYTVGPTMGKGGGGVVFKGGTSGNRG